MTASTLPLLAMPPSPRLFALVLDDTDDSYPDYVACCHPSSPVVWWGLHLDGEALLARHVPDGGIDTAHHLNPRHALNSWQRLYPLKLVWL